MNCKVVSKGKNVALVTSDEVLIKDVETARELIAVVQFETDCNQIIIDKSNLSEEFFETDAKLQRDLLNELIKYDKKIAIIGDFRNCSDNFNTLMPKLNGSRFIYFLPNVQEAINKFKI